MCYTFKKVDDITNAKYDGVSGLILKLNKVPLFISYNFHVTRGELIAIIYQRINNLVG